MRAPVEFQQGSLPGAVNLPILNDAERALIGTTYKNQGQSAAVQLGYQIVSGNVKDERVQGWRDYIAQNPSTVIYCFRGGKRSQITQAWLAETGVERPLIVGGYKRVRRFFMQEIVDFATQTDFLVVSGATGSGKTKLLQTMLPSYPGLDLESLAHHRGSAFGSRETPQPTQIDFENRLAVAMLKLEDKGLQGRRPIIEDESRLIGRINVPLPLFEKMRSSEVVWIEEPLEKRVENIFTDYILETAVGLTQNQTPRCQEENDILRGQALQVFEKYRKSVKAISRRLGGLRTQEILSDLEQSQTDFLNKNEIASNKVWIEKLLLFYYDPRYLDSLQRRQVKIVFKGSAADAQTFINSLKI